MLITHGKALYIWHTTSPIDTQNKKTKTKAVQGMGEFSEVCRRAVANLVPQLLVVIWHPRAWGPNQRKL